MARKTDFSKRKSPNGRLARAGANVVELLESRQMLTSVVTTFPVPTPDASQWDGSTAHISAGPGGNFWFTDATDNAIGKVSPDGTVTLFSLPVHNVPLNDGSGGVGPDDPAPTDLVVGPNGNIWFTENGVDRIGEITPDGTITEFTTPTAGSNPAGLTVGAEGNLWFAEQNNQAIGRITPDGIITEFPLSNLDVSYQNGLATGSDGNVWFIASDSSGNGAVASITSSGAVTSHALSSSPSSIAEGPDGNIWVGTDDGTIDQVDPAGQIKAFTLPDGAGINSLRAAADGTNTLWFSTSGNNEFGDITTAGSISEFALPTADSNISINDLSQSSGGKLWFIDSSNPQVGTIDLTHALLAGGANVSVTAGTTTTTTLASFADFSGPSRSDNYSATVTLGDGTTVPSTIAANSTGGFDVNVRNNWVVGYFNATITVTDHRDASRVATAAASINATAPQATGSGIDVSAKSGQLFSGTVATFTGVAVNSLSQYSASIDWGDGHVTQGTLSLNAEGGFDVTGSNRYASAGNYTVTATLNPYPGGIGINPGGPIIATGAIAKPVASPIAIGLPVSGGWASASSMATVSAGVTDGTGYSVQATSTAPFSGDVASFTVADPNAELSHYHATIQWNDPGINNWYFSLSNGPSAGVIMSEGNGVFTVATNANFTQSGLFHFVVTISDDRLGAGDAAVVGTAYGQIVVDTPFRWLPVFLADGAAGGAVPGSAANISSNDASNPVLAEHVKPISIPVKYFAGQTFHGDVAAYGGVVSGAANLADLKGTIHWGDGRTSPATFTDGKHGYVVVRGSHTYAKAGHYTPTVDVTQTLYVNGKPSALYPLVLPNAKSSATIITPPAQTLITTGGLPINTNVGKAFTDPVASFLAAPAGKSVVRIATIYWGDGTHSTGRISSASNQLTVTGGHLYKKAGKYTVWVAVTQTSTGGKVSKYLAYIKTTATVI